MSRIPFIALVLVAACSKTNPNYCEGNPDNNCNIEPDAGGSQGCTTSDECSGATPVCDPNDMVCVTCSGTDTGACSGTAPVCADDNSCRSCVAHGECTLSNACLPTGGCGDDATVAYVAATGDNANPCTKASPCKTITYAATLGKPYVKVESNLDEAVVLSNVNVTILGAPGTRLTRSSSVGAIVTVSGDSDVVIEDLVIRDGLGATGHGILVGASEPVDLTLLRVKLLNNSGNGVNVQGGKLTMSRTLVSGNTSGGAIISAAFDITNSMFVANGSMTVTTGGLMLTPQGQANVFRFNTVANNVSSDPTVTVRGMNCAFPFASASVIVANNQVAANCTFDYSLFPVGTAVTGTNKAGNAEFKSTDAANATAPDYFRIGATSAAIDGGEPSSSVMTDIDGDSRPQGGIRDIGADEYK